jgi:Protein of unknown function (DUF3572)
MRTAKPDRRTSRESAEALAIAALSFIAEEPERLGRFLALSGIGPESLRAAAREPGFLLGVLDYVTNDEALLISVSTDRGLDPADIARARDRLADERPPSPQRPC